MNIKESESNAIPVTSLHAAHKAYLTLLEKSAVKGQSWCIVHSAKVPPLADKWSGTALGLKSRFPQMTFSVISRRSSFISSPSLNKILQESHDTQKIQTTFDSTLENLPKRDLYLYLPNHQPLDLFAPLANSKTGFVNVDRHTLQHKRYANVFALGSAASLNVPTSIVSCALQANILVENMLTYARTPEAPYLPALYNGATQLSFVKDLSSMWHFKFQYDSTLVKQGPRYMFGWNHTKDHWSSAMYVTSILPRLYWYGVVKGIWFGPTWFWRPKYEIHRSDRI